VSENHNLHRPSRGEPLSVWIFSDDRSRRDALAQALRAEGQISLVESAATAHVAVLVLPASEEDAKPRADTFSPLSGLEIPALVLVDSESRAREAMARGARGAITQRPEGARVVAALHALTAGLSVVDFNLVHSAPEGETTNGPLTAREREVLELLVAGCSNRRIARRLGISEHTAKFHVNGILVKLSAGTRTEAVVKAARQGLVML
jgi:two-component system, NarL family, nitrate/nitrite response regulator NarL